MPVKRQLLGSSRVTTPTTKRVEREYDGTYGKHRTVSWVPNGQFVGTVELYVDVEALIRKLGPRAVKSQRGQSQMAGGAILVKRVGPAVHEPLAADHTEGA